MYGTKTIAAKVTRNLDNGWKKRHQITKAGWKSDWATSDAVGFLASALGKNDLCLKNFRLKAETIFFLSLSNENYTKMLGILSQLCVLLMALTYCILLSTCTLCARLLSPILWDYQEDGAGSSFFQLSSLPPLRFTSNRWKHPPETSAVSISISSGN